MFSKKLRLGNSPEKEKISVATALVLLAIDELINEKGHPSVYGYQIMTHLRENFNWDVKSGTVYPILKKLQEERYIGAEVIVQKGSKRHQVYYTLTKKGQKLINTIKELENDKLESILAPNISQSKNNVNSIPEFDPYNFAENYLAPILLDIDNKISQKISELVSKNKIEELDRIAQEIKKGIGELNLYKSLLDNELKKIEQIKKLKMPTSPNTPENTDTESDKDNNK